MNFQGQEENQKYYRKKQQVSKACKRSTHKHSYEKIIIQGLLGYCFAKRCTICGKIQQSNSHSTSKYEGLRSGPGLHFRDSLSAKEIHEKFPNVPVFERINKENYNFSPENFREIKL